MTGGIPDRMKDGADALGSSFVEGITSRRYSFCYFDKSDAI